MTKTEKPEIWILKAVEWQFFCTFTFSGSIPSMTRQKKMIFALLREFAGWHSVPFKRLLWVIRWENGEETGRLHMHALIGGIPVRRATVKTCFALMRRWESMTKGISRVRLYDPALDGGNYVLKPAIVHDNRVAMNTYETRKFSDTSDLLVAESVIRLSLYRRGIKTKSRK